nr:MAG TPA: hypothetical protein [Caudoviricetes sp.]
MCSWFSPISRYFWSESDQKSPVGHVLSLAERSRFCKLEVSPGWAC